MIHKIEKRMAELFPDNYIPLYSMVSFTNTQYKHALKYGNEQQDSIRMLIERYSLNENTSFDTLDELIFQYFKESVVG
jgi:kynurenine 3-monooxygenase